MNTHLGEPDSDWNADVYLYKCGIRLIFYFHHMREARLKEMVEGLNYWLNGCFHKIGRRPSSI